MYYVGSHWGHEEDGYICSSNRMRNAYRRRPTDFKRRVIYREYKSNISLRENEAHWLRMISQEELGTKYYNLTTNVLIAGNQASMSNETKEKIRRAMTGRKLSFETKTRMSESQKRVQPLLNKTISDQHKEILSKTHKGKVLSAEHRKALSVAHKGNQYRLGMKHSEETKKKISINHKSKRK